MRLLMVEDDAELAQAVRDGLREHGMDTTLAASVPQGRQRAVFGQYDVIVLDVLLPGGDGFALCRELRQRGLTTPILMLTARDAVADRILGLDSGADDYLIKPFAMDELLARVRSLLRRPPVRASDTLTIQDITIDHASHTVIQGGTPIPLTVKEYAILDYLMQHAGSVVTREQLIDHCWDFSYSAFSNITDVYIKQLRQKLGNGHDYIKTIRGVGYTFATA